jgi:hypothetical protein
MNPEQIKQRRQEVIDRFGPWTAHCIHLGNQLYTFDEPSVPQMDSRLRRFTQIAADITGKPLETLRVLDLACLEGHFGIEFALHGSEVVAMEGREANLAKVRFSKEMLSIDNLKPVLDDVRNLTKETYGYFDVVLCLGILYHLDAPDVMNFMKRMFEVCNRVTIIDTHITLFDAPESYNWSGKAYWGSYFHEHNPDATSDEKEEEKWKSLDNPRSFVLTRPSLCNLLRDVGFSSVYECLNPYEYHNPRWPLAPEGHRHVVWKNRFTFVAIKGQHQTIISSPITDTSPEFDRPENPSYIGAPSGGSWRGKLVRLLGPLKAPLRRIIRRQ